MLELGLKGKVAIVTGGSEGLGRATAERFAREGVRVAICARRKDVLEQTAEAIRRATGGEILAQPADVTRPDEVEGFVRAEVGRFGGVDILVNNAGTSAAAGFEKVDDATWQTDFDLKLMAAVRFCRLVIPIMKQRGGGRIVNVTTIGGKTPRPQSLPDQRHPRGRDQPHQVAGPRVRGRPHPGQHGVPGRRQERPARPKGQGR